MNDHESQSPEILCSSPCADDLPAPLSPVPVCNARLKHHVFVCTGKSCSANNSAATLEALREALKSRNLLYGKKGSLEAPVIVTECGSVGLCSVGPAVLVYPDGIWYYNVKPDDVAEIVDEHLVKGKPVERLLAVRLGSGHARG